MQEQTLHDELIVVDCLQYSNWNRGTFERLRRGGVTAVHVTVAYWEDARTTLSNLGRWNVLFQDYSELILPVRTAQDIRRAKRAGKVGIILGFQNASPIEEELQLVELLSQLNVRIMQLSYNNQSLLATGCYEERDGGITRFGRQVIREMNRVGMVIDMSHSGERSTLEAIEYSQRPIVISHANPAFFHPARRNKSDAVLRALAESGGMLGFSLYPLHLPGGGSCTLASFCDMVARTVDTLGIRSVGLGSDLCEEHPAAVLHWMRNGRWTKTPDFGEASAGDATWPTPPHWFQDGTCFPQLTRGLLERGFRPDEVAAIMGGNWLRFFDEAWQPQGEVDAGSSM